MRRVYQYFTATSLWVAVLWAGIGWFAAQSLVRLSMPAPLAIPPAFSADQGREITPLGRLLGDTAITKTKFAASDVRLIGLLAAGQRGSVLISVRNGPTRTLSAGVRDAEGWMLESVDANTIRISHFGSAIDIPTPRSSRGLLAN